MGQPLPDFRKLFDLTGRRALVTGGGMGFGEAISLAFAAYGCDAAVSDLKRDDVKKTFLKIKQKGGKGVALPANVAKPDEITAMVTTAAKELGGLDILINCAGIPQ